VEETTLVPSNGDTKAKGTGIKRVVDVDTVVFCIGDKVDENFGLPVKWNQFVKNPTQASLWMGYTRGAQPETNQPIEVSLWLAVAGSQYGLVGIARKDGENGARAVLQYLHTCNRTQPEAVLANIQNLLGAWESPSSQKRISSAWKRLNRKRPPGACWKNLNSARMRRCWRYGAGAKPA